jgi:hypothetical protein
MQLLILDDIDAAKVEVTAATEHFRSADLPFDLTWGLFVQGSIAQRRGELDEAERAWDEALRMRHGVGDVAGVAMLLDPLASIAAHRGDLDRAARLSGVVARLERITGAGLNERNRQLRGDFAPETMRDDLATRAAWREGEALSIDEAVAYALEGSPP